MKRKLIRFALFRLWSILISSCRQFVGTLADPEKKEPPAAPESLPNTPVGLGISANKAAPLGLTGTWLPANGWPLVWSGQSALEPVAGFGHKSLKLPFRSARDGTGIWVKICGTRSYRHSSDQKM